MKKLVFIFKHPAHRQSAPDAFFITRARICTLHGQTLHDTVQDAASCWANVCPCVSSPIDHPTCPRLRLPIPPPSNRNDRNRTCDSRPIRPTLYLLSYVPSVLQHVVVCCNMLQCIAMYCKCIAASNLPSRCALGTYRHHPLFLKCILQAHPSVCSTVRLPAHCLLPCVQAFQSLLQISFR